jgi:hypothetical protein
MVIVMCFPSLMGTLRSRRDESRQRLGSKAGSLRVDRTTELLLQLDEPICMGKGRQLARDLEDLSQLLISVCVIAGKTYRLVGITAEHRIKRRCEELRISKCVTDAVAGDRVAVIAGVANQSPAGTDRVT